MSLTKIFNVAAGGYSYDAVKINDNVLQTRCKNENTISRTTFDFALGIVMYSTPNSEHNCRTLLFSEMERPVLELHRETLIELGGNPLPLPPQPRTVEKMLSRMKPEQE